jgi:hypothetical protein
MLGALKGPFGPETSNGKNECFWGVERKFLEPLVRFARGDVRDHIG